MTLFAKLELALATVLVTSACRRCRKAAFDNALAAFGSTHRIWLDALFDRHFLSTHGAAALEARHPEELARAWTQQFHYRDPTQRDHDVRRLTPAAETFLELWRRADEGCADEMTAWLRNLGASGNLSPDSFAR